MTRSYDLYCVYDRAGVLLYIGRTIQGFKTRLQQHRQNKRPWLDRMGCHKVRTYKSEWALDLVEERAIRIFQPPYNIKESREFHRKRIEYDRENNPLYHMRFRGEGSWLAHAIKGETVEDTRHSE